MTFFINPKLIYCAPTKDIDEIVSPIPTSVIGFSIIIVGTAIISTRSSAKIPSSIKSLAPNSCDTVSDKLLNSFNPISETSLSWDHNKISLELIAPVPALVAAIIAANCIPLRFLTGDILLTDGETTISRQNIQLYGTGNVIGAIDSELVGYTGFANVADPENVQNSSASAKKFPSTIIFIIAVVFLAILVFIERKLSSARGSSPYGN